jgi:hypothetical protein
MAYLCSFTDPGPYVVVAFFKLNKITYSVQMRANLTVLMYIYIIQLYLRRIKLLNAIIIVDSTWEIIKLVAHVVNTKGRLLAL